jgi:hypothetical protein
MTVQSTIVAIYIMLTFRTHLGLLQERHYETATVSILRLLKIRI